jgi:predicted nucleotidyltransferase
MAVQTQHRDWSVTEEKINEAVRRIVETSDPLQVVLFGSRARGDHREDSDVDLAVVLDAPEEEVRRLLPSTTLRGLRMEVTLIVVSKTKYDLHRPWMNSVFNYIDREGVVLYDRNHQKSSYSNALQAGSGRRVHAAVSAA